MKRTGMACSFTLLMGLVFIGSGCQSPSKQTRKGKHMDSQLYLEIIEVKDGKHRIGIAYPEGDGKKFASSEFDLPPDGIERPVVLDGHKITLFCRYKKQANKPDAGDGN